MAEFTGSPTGQGKRIAVVASRFNSEITERLADGAMQALVQHGVSSDDIDIVWVPGAWELTGAARKLMTTDRYSAIVAVGAVIRGDTAHFEYVAGAASTGLAHASAEFDVPVGFGVLTCDTDAQAEERAGGAHGNKGWDAALAALEMADLFDRLDAADEG